MCVFDHVWTHGYVFYTPILSSCLFPHTGSRDGIPGSAPPPGSACCCPILSFSLMGGGVRRVLCCPGPASGLHRPQALGSQEWCFLHIPPFFSWEQNSDLDLLLDVEVGVSCLLFNHSRPPLALGFLVQDSFQPFPRGGVSSTRTPVALVLCLRPGSDRVCCLTPSSLRLLLCRKEGSGKVGRALFLSPSSHWSSPALGFCTKWECLWGPFLSPVFLVSPQWRAVRKCGFPLCLRPLGIADGGSSLQLTFNELIKILADLFLITCMVVASSAQRLAQVR